MDDFRFSLQSEPHDLESWLALARQAEAAGFESLLVGDHPGNGASPWPALGAAAAVTSTLKLGTYVLQSGLRSPIQAASDAATLDVLAPGRVRLGLGAGHTFQEWSALGRQRPHGTARADRLVEFVDAVADLLEGKTVDLDGDYLNLVGARLDNLPASGTVEIAVGGTHPRILAAAARRADVVALSGLGRTLPDGHRHEVNWATTALDAHLKLIAQARADSGRTPAIEVLVQQVTITDDRARQAEELATRLSGATPQDLLSTPFVLVGTIDELAAQVGRNAAEHGIDRYVVREAAMPAIEQLIRYLGS